ncbi:YXYXY domain-containing protein [Gillisia sp. Hel_I_86]|uniref:helix-turn-helix and ligand-binding sensor domain-containing protein n=1 Tax=Gillisia sp. Hel_I_86 TaxID=1249981 RepID=UPI001198E6A3|nr:triple tyrosine motif-containing protein [Gillisia sp. Hel_I_86]TVZ26140.1 YXYXY domain-containing protein [Gillisia sp. Hel_I_86]
MRLLIFFLTVLSTFLSLSQELPPVVNYGPNEYGAGNQNWMISQGSEGDFYFANGAGLLEYNGEKWKLYPVPNNSIVRSVRTVKNRIYTGAYMEAGFWERDENGTLDYTSIIDEFPEGIHDGELFWDISLLEGMVIFRSFAGIYFYNPESEKVLELELPENLPVSGIFKLNDNLYFQLVGGGLYSIKKGEPQLEIPYSNLKDVTIKYLYRSMGELRFLTGNSGFFSWNGQRLTEYNKNLSKKIKYTNIFAATALSDGGMVLGTVGKGIIQIDHDGNIIYDYNQENILLNNTILSLFVDRKGNIWAGLDFGISMINPNSSFRSFQDNKGKIGSVYTSVLKSENLYLGTNQGLYLKEKGTKDFSLIPGTNGQVWSINEIDGDLFCGHDTGTFLIKGNTATKICDQLGTWFIKKIKDNLYAQGHYYGFSFLKKENGKFISSPLVEGFPHSSRYIEVESDSVLWINNEHKGVFKVKYNESLNEIEKLQNFKFSDSIWATSSMFLFADSLYYSTKTKIYQYNPETNKFSDHNKLNSKVSEGHRISGKMINNNNEKLWGFAGNYIFYIRPSAISGDYEKKMFYIDETFRNIADGYENISAIGEDEYLLGIANGYLKFKDKRTNPKQYKVQISQITNSALESQSEKSILAKRGKFDSYHNNFSFQFTAPVYNKYTKALYSYRLVGLSSKWSEWNQSSEAIFKNLGFGDYSFEVRSKVANEITEPVSYKFSIGRPFYLSNLAIGLYILVFIGIILLTHFLYRRYHKKQIAENERALKLQNLEAEKKIIKLQNEQLEKDMTNKNKELAVSTMSLIKKNEFLTNIKDQLKESESSKVKSVIKTIDKDINEEYNWNLFKDAFNNADKEFFKKIKSKHPDLTSNDLKLCAYLRLNLSSKEIAPLLNISVKSVEIKRYRLRKKMVLERNTNLADYILEI